MGHIKASKLPVLFWKTLPKSILVIFTSVLVGCGGGDKNDDSPVTEKEIISATDSQKVAENISVSLAGVVVITQTGTPPESTNSEQDPITTLESSDLTIQPGNTAIIEANVETASGEKPSSIYVAVIGSSMYFELPIEAQTEPSATRITGASDNSSFMLEIELPENLGDGKFCLAVSAMDTQSLVSENAEACITVDAETSPAFTNEFLSGRTFTISDNGVSDIERLVFDNAETGSIRFAPNPDNEFDPEDVNSTVWSIDNGVLLFTETGGDAETWDWVFTPTAISENFANVSYSVSSTKGSDSGVLTMQAFDASENNVFTESEVSGNTFVVSFNDGNGNPDGALEYVFYSDRTGTWSETDNNNPSDLTWSVNSIGNLIVKTEFFTDIYTLTSGTPSSGDLNIKVNDKDEGKSHTTGTITQQ